MKKEILIVANPHAGRGKINKYLPKICENLEKQGYELEVKYTSKLHNGEDIVKNYERYIDAVIACGGDGTLNEVINGVIKCNKKIDIAFIPFGTINDYSKTAKISRKRYTLSKTLSQYTNMKVDVGSFNDKYFFYIAAFGAFTDIAYTTKQKEKNKVGKIAYYRRAISELNNIKAYKATIVTDNEIIKDEFIYGGISNSISIGGFKWFKNDEFSINDGLFEVILVRKPKNKIELVKVFDSILKKKYDQEGIYYFKSKHLKVDFEEDVSWTLDGKFGGNARSALIQNNMNKVTLLLPKK